MQKLSYESNLHLNWDELVLFDLSDWVSKPGVSKKIGNITNERSKMIFNNKLVLSPNEIRCTIQLS